MAKISSWLSESCLTLNVSKTACMYFYIRKNGSQPDIMVKGERIQTVSHFKYLGITIDSQLTFKKHVKQVCKTLKFNFSNFSYLKPAPPRCGKNVHAFNDFFTHFLLHYKLVTSWKNNTGPTANSLQTSTQGTGQKIIKLSPL